MMTVSVYQPPGPMCVNSRPGCRNRWRACRRGSRVAPSRRRARRRRRARSQEHAVAVLVAAVANARIQILAGLHAEHIAAERLAHRAVATLRNDRPRCAPSRRQPAGAGQQILVALAVMEGADLLHRQLARQRRHFGIDRHAGPVDRLGIDDGRQLRAQVPVLLGAGRHAASEQHVRIGARVDPAAGEGAGRGRAAVDGLHHLDAVAGGLGARPGLVRDAQCRRARCRAAVHHQRVRRRSVGAQVGVQRQHA